MSGKEKGHRGTVDEAGAAQSHPLDGDTQSDARLDAALRASGVELAPHVHQRDAVRWWVAREGTSDAARAVASGGILADEMGLGKSMSAVMSVMFCRSALAGPAPRPRAPAPLPGTWAGTSAPIVAAGRASAGGRVVLAPTLIVCPKSLLIQWEREILRYTTLGPADIHLFYGRAGRRITRRQVTDKVFVLTTYEIVLGSFEHSTQSSSTTASATSSLGRRATRSRVLTPKAVADTESVLHGIEWDRIVLDEAHVIRNWQTSKTHRAVCALRARRRWCLTGTAFNNSASDVIALCRFVGVAPYSDPQWWANASESDAAQWRTLFLLRRTKAALVASVPATGPTRSAPVPVPSSSDSATPGPGTHTMPCGGPTADARRGPMSMPPKVEKIRRVALSEREAAFYDRLAVGAVADFGAFTQSKGSDKSRMFGQMLEWLTRLRQACCDPLVLKGRAATIVYSPTSRADLARHESCCVRCHAASAGSLAPMRLACGHTSCNICAQETAGVCVLCFGATTTTTQAHHQYHHHHYHHPHSAAGDDDGGASPVPRPMPTEPACGPSSRTASMVRFMNKIFARDSQCKMVVFSQWSTYLDLIESAVVTHVGVDYVRIDGAVRQIERRNALVSRFATDPSARCLLMTIGVGSVGLNLVCANYVLLMDAHYNPFAEAQAVDRVHRIGQTRPVRVVRFLSDASVDAAVAQIQAAKRAGAAAFLGGPVADDNLDRDRNAANGDHNAKDDNDDPAVSRRGAAMVRGIDERQLRSILSEMIAARRDVGDSTLDSFVLTKSSSGLMPSRGMQCNLGITCKDNVVDVDDVDDDIDDDYQEDETHANDDGDDDNDDDDDGLYRHCRDSPDDDDDGDDDDDDNDSTSRHRQQQQHIDNSDTDGGASDSGLDKTDNGDGERQLDRQTRPCLRSSVCTPPSRHRFLVTRRADNKGEGGDNEYDIDLDDQSASAGSLPRRPALQRLKRTADVVQRKGKLRRPSKRGRHQAVAERNPAARD
nr:SNF2 family DNA dependent ATPase [Pandoravirus aubagnensis]